MSPAPDGGYPNENTAEGENALFSLAANGVRNTAIGFNALFSNTGGGANTAVGASALANNTANDNTACGSFALANNTTGSGNTAFGIDALMLNVNGNSNHASGHDALFHNTSGSNNAASGANALFSNTAGGSNTADGSGALFNNTTASFNTATGQDSLEANQTGHNNTADGQNALKNNTTGSNNIAVGSNAGEDLTTGDNNIDIFNHGVAGEANTIRIGKEGTQKSTFVAGISGTAMTGGQVVVNSGGQLGVAPSSARFKEQIKPMNKASEAILQLKPVTFRYKEEIDPAGIPQFGLVAEEVEKVNPALVDRDSQGKVYTVRYDAVNAMLLNEFLKEHHKVGELEATIAQLKTAAAKQEAVNAEQRKEMEAVTARLKEQDSQIQKVSDQVELSKPAPQTVGNDQ